MTNKLYEQGSELRGKKIVAQARKITPQEVIVLSSKHRGRRVKLKGSAYCVIDVPLLSVRQRKGK